MILAVKMGLDNTDGLLNFKIQMLAGNSLKMCVGFEISSTFLQGNVPLRHFFSTQTQPAKEKA